jgi:hypothetical protein
VDRGAGAPSAAAARRRRARPRALAQASMLALTAFPQAPLSNTLLREFSALAGQAQAPLPLVEGSGGGHLHGPLHRQVARSPPWPAAMTGTLCGGYYDLPPESQWTARAVSAAQHGQETAADFARLCAERA